MTKPLKILLCGHRSFAAQGIVERLASRGHAVHTYSRGKPGREGNAISGPTMQMAASDQFDETYDCVINYIVLKDLTVAENEAFMRELLAFCSRHAVPHLMHFSSASVYPGSLGIATETSEIEDVPTRKGAYGSLKVAQDLVLLKEAPPTLRVSFVRPGFILAPGLIDPIIGMAFRAGNNRLLLLGNKSNSLPVITRDMVHDATVAIAERETVEMRPAYLILDHKSPTRYEWLSHICRGLGFGKSVQTFPTPVWRTAALGGEMVARAGGMQLRPWKIIGNMCRKQWFDPRSTQRVLGLDFTTDWKRAVVDAFPRQSPNYELPSLTPSPAAKTPSKIAFIGFGQIVQQKHLAAIKAVAPQAQVLPYDIAAGTAKSGHAVRKLGDAPMEPADLIVVASPGPVHANAIEHITDANAAVLIEKPLCYNRAELEQWGAFAASRPGPVVVCQNYRFKKNVRNVLEHLRQFNTGQIVQADVHFDSPSISKEWRTWTRDERRARTLLMDYAVHYLDIACMFNSQSWSLKESAYTLDYHGFTSSIRGTLASDAYNVNFLARQGNMPRRARIALTFENYDAVISFFPDGSMILMADDGGTLHKQEGKRLTRAFYRKVLDKLTSRDSDDSHIWAYRAALDAGGLGQSISVANVASFYGAIADLGEAVYAT